MTAIRKRAVILGAAVALALCVSSAVASFPAVEIGGMSMQGGTLGGYLAQHARGGTTGLCFDNRAPDTSYACFEAAVKASGLETLFDGNEAITVLAPTDGAFAHLAGEVGNQAVATLLADPKGAADFVRAAIVPGSYSLSTLATKASAASPSIVVTTLDGASITIAFGDIGPGIQRTDVKVGSDDAVDGQSFVLDRPMLFGDGNLLIPLGRVTQASWGD